MGMNGVQMGNQQHRDSTFRIKETAFADRLIALLTQLLHKVFFQLLLCHPQDAFKMGHIHSHSFTNIHCCIPPYATTVAFSQSVCPMARQAAAMLHVVHPAVSC